MKYGIDCGHNVQYDSGAVGIKKEDNLTMAVGTCLMTFLRQLGCEVINCTPQTAKGLDDSLHFRCAVANHGPVDYFLSIHFNSGGGRGVEAYAMSQAGRELADKLCKEVSALGFYNRGVKDGSWLYVLKNTTMPAVLLEVGFVDSANDMALYDQVGADGIADAICRALTGRSPRQEKIERWLGNMDIKALQHTLNILQIRDKNGNALDEDGMEGELTKSAKAKAKEVLEYIMR